MPLGQEDVTLEATNPLEFAENAINALSQVFMTPLVDAGQSLSLGKGKRGGKKKGETRKSSRKWEAEKNYSTVRGTWNSTSEGGDTWLYNSYEGKKGDKPRQSVKWTLNFSGDVSEYKLKLRHYKYKHDTGADVDVLATVDSRGEEKIGSFTCNGGNDKGEEKTIYDSKSKYKNKPFSKLVIRVEVTSENAANSDCNFAVMDWWKIDFTIKESQ